VGMMYMSTEGIWSRCFRMVVDICLSNGEDLRDEDSRLYIYHVIFYRLDCLACRHHRSTFDVTEMTLLLSSSFGRLVLWFSFHELSSHARRLVLSYDSKQTIFCPSGACLKTS
jgi:hypothetical protein